MDIVARRFAWRYALTLFELKYRYTALGVLWNFLEPVLYLGVLSLVFSVVNRMDIADYAVFLFGALMPWRYFERVVNTSMESIVGGEWLLKKIHVSPFSLPVARWIVASIELLFSIGAMFLFLLILGHAWTLHLLVLPLSLFLWSVMALGTGLIAALLFTFFRDIRTVVQLLLMLLFFSSPILFKAELFPEGTPQGWLMRLHPFTYFAALVQKPIYHAAWPETADWLVAGLVSFCTLAIGIRLMQRHQHELYFHL